MLIISCNKTLVGKLVELYKVYLNVILRLNIYLKPSGEGLSNFLIPYLMIIYFILLISERIIMRSTVSNYPNLIIGIAIDSYSANVV